MYNHKNQGDSAINAKGTTMWTLSFLPLTPDEYRIRDIMLVVGILAALVLNHLRNCAIENKKIPKLDLNRPLMSNEEFLALIGLPQDKNEICLAFRAAMADTVKLSPESIYPSDLLDQLNSLTFLGFDQSEIYFHVERQLGVRISGYNADKKFATFTPPIAFGDFIRHLAENWDEITVPDTKRKASRPQKP